MPKSSFSDEATIVRDLLRTSRERAGLTQLDVAKALNVPQSYVSKYETGERRLDFTETSAVCVTLGISIVDFAKEFAQRARRKAKNSG
jgi:transcriptional regulator with XRE-family HTH domain